MPILVVFSLRCLKQVSYVAGGARNVRQGQGGSTNLLLGMMATATTMGGVWRQALLSGCRTNATAVSSIQNDVIIFGIQRLIGYFVANTEHTDQTRCACVAVFALYRFGSWHHSCVDFVCFAVWILLYAV